MRQYWCSATKHQMFVLEYKVQPKPPQIQAIEEAIRTHQFVRNKVLRYWMDHHGQGKAELFRYNTDLRAEYEFVKELNSHACQTAVERVLRSITRFFDNCQRKVPGKKRCDPAEVSSAKERAPRQGYPKFQKHNRSVEYKTSGWKLDSQTKKHINFTDQKNIGRLKLIGSRDLYYFQPEQIKRVRIVRRADGYYVQLVIKLDPRDTVKPFSVTGKCIGIDVGLKEFYADSNGYLEPITQFYRKSERQLNRANRKKSKKYRKGVTRAFPNGGALHGVARQSLNYHKARTRYARKHLKVSRQRTEYCKRVAYSVIQSNDLVAYEDLNVQGMVRNRKLAKSITDAGWSTFRQWLEYFGYKYGKATVPVSPHYTSQICSNCGVKVKKSLSTRTHVCQCGYVEDRDVNAAINILRKGLSTVGHTETHYAWGETPSSLVGGGKGGF